MATEKLEKATGSDHAPDTGTTDTETPAETTDTGTTDTETPAETTDTGTTDAETLAETRESVFDSMRGTRDALTVKRVFGDSYEVDGLTIIPVARVAGGAGGGGGEGTDEEQNQGRGFGGGFGIGANPIGVYEVRDGELTWKPSIDVTRVIHGGQVLAGIIAVCAALVIWRRS